MKFACSQIVINPLYPVEQAGHIQQTEKISTLHDDLHARLLLLEDQFLWLHVSVDNLGLPIVVQQEIEKKLQQQYPDKEVHVTLSCTHSHHCANPSDDQYRKDVTEWISTAALTLEPKEVKEMKVTYRSCFFDGVGKSRISNHEVEHLYLDLIQLSDQEKVLAEIIIHNVHPTILQASTPYFSAEYPGYVLKQLNIKEPAVFHTFMQGADGDISTRFTRPSQDYAAVEFLGGKLLHQLDILKKTPAEQVNCTLFFDSQVLSMEHEFEPLDLGDIPDNITDREKETIGYGQIMRQRLKDNPDRLTKEILISVMRLGTFNILFMPNEMFSWYLGEVDKKKTCIACYSNGYSPYVTGPSSRLLTYETFTDTLTLNSKTKIIELLHQWG